MQPEICLCAFVKMQPKEMNKRPETNCMVSSTQKDKFCFPFYDAEYSGSKPYALKSDLGHIFPY